MSKVRGGGKKADLRSKGDINHLEALETVTVEEAATIISSHLKLISLAQKYGMMQEKLMAGRNSKLTSKFLDAEVKLLAAVTEYGKLFNK